MTEKKIHRGWIDFIIENIVDALTFFFPSLAKSIDETTPIDLSEPYEESTEPIESTKPNGIADPVASADKFHSSIGAESDKNSRRSDVFVIFYPKSGKKSEKNCVAIEIQAYSATNMPIRAFEIFYRSRDAFRCPVTVLVIATENNTLSNYHPEKFLGTTLDFWYNLVKVRDYKVEDLKSDNRPFAIAMLTAKYKLLAKGDPDKRFKYAAELFSIIRQRQLGTEKAGSYVAFVKQQLKTDEGDMDPQSQKELKMRLIPLEEAVKNIQDRRAREEGKLEGMREGELKGMREGELKGMRKGERKIKLEMARKLHFKEKMDVSKIASLTELTEKQILSAIKKDKTKL